MARRALATYLNRARATVAREDRVVFCNGSAQGIGLLCRVLRERGVRRIAVEDPGHADHAPIFRRAGWRPRVFPSTITASVLIVLVGSMPGPCSSRRRISTHGFGPRSRASGRAARVGG